jgi:hypothetical protein
LILRAVYITLYIIFTFALSVTGQTVSFQSSADTVKVLLDSANVKIIKHRVSINSKVDSLKSKINPSSKALIINDSLRTLSSKSDRLNQVLVENEKDFTNRLETKVSKIDSINVVKDKAKQKVEEVNQLSNAVGVGTLGEDLQSNVDLKIPDTSVNGFAVPDAPSPDLIKGVPEAPNLQSELPELKGSIPKEVDALKAKTSDYSGVAKDATEVVEQTKEYTNEIKTIKEEGLDKSDKLDELAESQISKVNEISAIQQQEGAALGQMNEYKDIIEQYKQEKAIKEELEKKAKDVATDIVMANQPKVDATMKKINKYKRKFSQVHDVRNLPKRAPNPMKDLPVRERILPGFSLYTFSAAKQWLQLDPQGYYRITGNWSVGLGGVYRFSIKPQNFSFRDFGSVYGGKIFTEYNVFKGFNVHIEGQRLRWKPWYLQATEPNRIDNVTVLAAGISKSYNVTPKVKGYAQALYHYSYGETDPYNTRIIVRVGFDFSLKKKEPKPWDKK